MSTEKPFSEACERNRDPILAVLRQHFADRGSVLEIGSGTGQHAVHFAAALPQLIWQCSDLEANLPGIRLSVEQARLANLPPPLALDVRGPWPSGPFDAAFTANTLHIMSWEEVRALFAALPAVLADDAVLAIYGPFNYGGRFTSPSNRAFDAWLRQRSRASAIRDLEAVDELARSSGFELLADRAMPANNRTLLWRRHALSREPRADERASPDGRPAATGRARGSASGPPRGLASAPRRGDNEREMSGSGLARTQT